MTSMDQFKGVDKVEKRSINFGLRIHNIGETRSQFQWIKRIRKIKNYLMELV